MVNLFINELFCFDQDIKRFYSHFELIYFYEKHPKFRPTLLTTDEFYKTLISPFTRNQTLTSLRDSIKIVDDDENIEEAKDDNSITYLNMIELSEDRHKSSFETFIGLCDLRKYKQKVSLELLACATLLFDRTKCKQAFMYNRMRNLGYKVESGSSYGFDFLLYDDGKEDETANIKSHVHANYSLVIAEEGSEELKFVDLHRKQKIANNYKKVF